jgi:hypothetical protein
LNPSNLEVLAEKRRKVVQRNELQLKQGMDRLMSLFYMNNEMPGARTLQGLEGIKEAYNDALRCKKDVYLIRDRIMDQDDIQVMEIKDYIQNPKPNGYRSLHMIIRVPVYFMNRKQLVPVEVQIRTESMDLWASLEHDIKYKSLYTDEDCDIDFSEELLEASRLIYQAEAKMEKMNNYLEG